MALFTTFSRLGAAAALSFALLAPAALADERGRGDRGGYHDRGDRGDRGHRGNRGDHDRGRRGDHDRGRRGDWDRGRHHGDRGRDRGNNWRDKVNHRDWRDRSRHYSQNRHYKPRRHYSAPRVIHRYSYSSPRYYTPRPRVQFHYNHGYYHGGYRIGSRYSYRPNTIIIRDYGGYGLYAPPHGYHWVRDPYSNDAVLASVATGAIIGLAVGILSQ